MNPMQSLKTIISRSEHLEFSGPVASGPASSESTNFSPNYVIEFARLRTAHINAWLDRQLKDMSRAAEETQALNDVLAVVAHYHALPNGITEKGDHEKLTNAMDAAINRLAPDSPVRAKLHNLLTDKKSLINIKGGGGTDTTINVGELESLKTQLDTMLKSVDRGSQEAQLFINQKMGEKNEIMQLASMLIQQLHETSKSILQRA